MVEIEEHTKIVQWILQNNFFLFNIAHDKGEKLTVHESEERSSEFDYECV